MTLFCVSLLNGIKTWPFTWPPAPCATPHISQPIVTIAQRTHPFIVARISLLTYSHPHTRSHPRTLTHTRTHAYTPRSLTTQSLSRSLTSPYSPHHLSRTMAYLHSVSLQTALTKRQIPRNWVEEVCCFNESFSLKCSHTLQGDRLTEMIKTF